MTNKTRTTLRTLSENSGTALFRRRNRLIASTSTCNFASLAERKAGRHVEKYRSFFQWCRDASTPTAHVGLQTIVTTRPPNSRESVRDVSFLARSVFPGSALPTLDDIRDAVKGVYEIRELKT